MKRVAVIGVGPSGIGALRQLSQHPEIFEPVGFEKNREVGGLWNYSDFTDTDEYGLPCYSSLYKQLRTNIPTCVMRYQDQDFPEGQPSFNEYKVVKDYLDDYCKKFDLNKYCKFQTIVTSVIPKDSSDGCMWLVTSRNLTNDDVATEIFDAVIVCNGKESAPFIPKYPGIETFKGVIVHTKNVRDLEEYKGRNIIIVGCATSALDMIFALADQYERVIVSHRWIVPLTQNLPDNVSQVAEIREVLPNGVVLTDGECREADTIIFATGYRYEFPFLDDGMVKLTADGRRVQPLYNHTFHIEYPTLSFTSIVKDTIQFQFALLQAEYICLVLQDKIKLPSKAEMYRREEEDFQLRIVNTKKDPRHIHILWYQDLRQFVQRIENEMGKSMMKTTTMDAFDEAARITFTDFENARKRTYIINDDNLEITMQSLNSYIMNLS